MCVPPKPTATNTVASSSSSTTPTLQNNNNNENNKKALNNNSNKLSSLTSWSSWKEERQQQIDALNDRVQKLTKVAITNHSKKQQPGGAANKHKQPQTLALEYVHAQQPMTTLVAGAPVYQMRSATMVYLYCVSSAVLILWGMTKNSFFATALSMATIFVGYDLYSGVLHVVLDHPSNIALPIWDNPVCNSNGITQFQTIWSARTLLMSVAI